MRVTIYRNLRKRCWPVRTTFTDLRRNTRNIFALMRGTGDDAWDPGWEGHPDEDEDDVEEKTNY